MTTNTFSGIYVPGMPDFQDPDSEFAWLEENGHLNDPQRDVDQAIGEIAKYLPMGSNPSERNLESVARQVVEGKLSAKEAADRLSNKKVITLKK